MTVNPTAGAKRARSGNYKRLIVAGQHVCLDCQSPIVAAPHIRGQSTRLRCSPCGEARRKASTKIRTEAYAAVARAITRGELARPYTLQCGDCGTRRAEVYDHRDYTKPLQVVAVCWSCNVLRGPADVWPSGFDPSPRAVQPEKAGA